MSFSARKEKKSENIEIAELEKIFEKSTEKSGRFNFKAKACAVCSA